MEQLDYNLLFRWFVGLGIDDAVGDHSVFSKNRDRLLGGNVAANFLAAALRHPKVKGFLSDDHFSVMLEACLRHDGTLVEAWASLKSFRASVPFANFVTSSGSCRTNFANERTLAESLR